jgi:hypothetical protein
VLFQREGEMVSCCRGCERRGKRGTNEEDWASKKRTLIARTVEGMAEEAEEQEETWMDVLNTQI